MDHILIEQLTARCIIGVNKHERRQKQDVAIDITMAADLRAAGRSDHLRDTLDYDDIEKRVLRLVEDSSFRLLEALAQAVADVCLEDRRVAEVMVRISKPRALPFSRNVAVEITRTRQ